MFDDRRAYLHPVWTGCRDGRVSVFIAMALDKAEPVRVDEDSIFARHNQTHERIDQSAVDDSKSSFLPPIVRRFFSKPAGAKPVEREYRGKRPRRHLSLKDPENEETMEYLSKLKLSKRDADLLYTVFCDIDLDKSGNINMKEFYKWFNMERTPFTDSIFTIMDQDKSDEVDFREFSMVLWNYLSFTTDGLAMFAFGLGDTDNSGISPHLLFRHRFTACLPVLRQELWKRERSVT